MTRICIGGFAVREGEDSRRLLSICIEKHAIKVIGQWDNFKMIRMGEKRK